MQYDNNIFADVVKNLNRTSVTLIAVYDPYDRLQYANDAFWETYSVDPEEKILWADIMRRNHLSGRGTPIEHADFEAWLRATSSRRGKSPSWAFESNLVDGRWL